jgi:hypothetical protein
MEVLDALDFNMTHEMHPKDVSPMHEQKIDHHDHFYVPIFDHLMGTTCVLECSQT